MILDTLANAHLYLGYHPRLASAFEYLRTENLAGLSGGKHAIQGEDLFALVNLYETKPPAACAWEAHRKYIDVQYMVEGGECMGWAPLVDLTITKPYDDSSDCLFLSGQGTMLQVNPGMFAVFAPNDGHMPCVMIDGQPGKVRKIGVKVRV